METANLNVEIKEDISNLCQIYQHVSKIHWNTLLSLIHLLRPNYNLKDFIDILPLHKQKLKFIDIINTIGKLGIKIKSKKIYLRELDKRVLPCLLKNKDNKLFILIKKEEDHFIAIDCASKQEIKIKNLKLKETIFFFQEIEQENTENTNTEEHKNLGISWFRSSVDRFDRLFLQIFFASLIIGLFSVLTPFFIIYVFMITSTGTADGLLSFAIGAFSVAAIDFLLRSIRSKSINWISGRMGHITGLKLFEKLMWIPSIYTERSSISAQISRLKTLDSTKEFFRGPIFTAILDLPIAFVAFILVIAIAKYVALIPLLSIGIIAACSIFFNYKLSVANKKMTKLQSNYTQLSIEFFEKRMQLRNAGITENMLSRLRDLSAKTAKSRKKVQFYSSNISSLIQSICLLTNAATIFVGIFFVWENIFPASTVIATMLLCGKILSPFQTLANSIGKFHQFQSNIKQINKLMDIQTEKVEENISNKHISDLKGHIQFLNVGIRYSKERDPIFAGLNFDIYPGEVIAITGASGTGKSTILKLINNLYKPNFGSIYFDEFDVRQFSPIQLRKKIAYLPQSPHFFHGSILDNLRLSNPLASEAQINYVLDQALLNEDINHIPEKLNAKITKKLLRKLPSNFIYKLAFARTLISQSRIVLLDSLPFSALSEPLGAKIYENIQKWKGHRTTVLVTDREDFLVLADRVILLRENKNPIISSPEAVIENQRSEKMVA